ncbi:Protein serine/threonine phosphatase PrpC, regulation of stationary phase [Minicystis rosea]|nr:Protein serine/threonine phosphatase PrpC, regulation of stationary phase [Minicystis rosea]
MNLCPTCGAAYADDDVICAHDGTHLAASATPVASSTFEGIPSSGACDACDAERADDGDGYCRVCGHKLAAAARVVPGALSPGMRLGAYMVRQTAGDRATASSPDGTEVLLIVGDPDTLFAEAEVLERIGPHRSFPRVVERDHDPTGAFLALSAPAWSSQMLADVVQARTVEETVAAIAGLLDLAERVEQAGFGFQPSPSDLLLAPDGTVLLSRVRGARRLPRGQRLDARHLLESLSEVFLAPAIRGPTSLVRLLVPSRDAGGSVSRTVEHVRAGLAQVREEMSAPLGKGPIADLCDPGLWRPYNQDSTAVDSGASYTGEPFAVLVVCDGVSSSSFSERASQVAARAARDALGHFARSPDVCHEPATSAVAQAIRAAHLAICADHVARPVSDPPGTTIAAALVFRRRLTVGWVGDSRAYWLTARGAEQLTHDHSWVNEAIARGEVKDADEVQGALAHTITRCLGPLEVGDVPVEIDPDVRSRELVGPGLVLVCSDGLWNYAPKPADIAAVIRAASDETNAVEVTRLLVNYALARGGQDNVSVGIYAHA